MPLFRSLQIAALAAIGLTGVLGSFVLAGPITNWPTTQPARSPDRLADQPELTNSIGMKLRFIKAGEFLMGSPLSEGDRRPDENQHKIRVTTSLYMGTCPVTRGQFAAFILDSGYKTDAEKAAWAWAQQPSGAWVKAPDASWRNPGLKQADDCPVVDVTWDDAVCFCQWLSRKEGRIYRLPSEAEWEYACRAGTTSAFYIGNDKDMLGGAAWYAKNSNGMTHTVGAKAANAWGLYDMHGNVWQWCVDIYAPYSGDAIDPVGPIAGAGDGSADTAHRVARGGSWCEEAVGCRSALREHARRSTCANSDGFRVCLEASVEAGCAVPAATTKRLVEDSSIGVEVVLIHPGTFVEGSPPDEPGRGRGETPHNVKLTKAFYMGRYPVTRGQFRQFVRETQYKSDAERLGYALDWVGFALETLPGAFWEKPGFVQGEDDHPVVDVSSRDAEEFCRWLSRKEGTEYRLPTEAEWEYCCRAGTIGPSYLGGDAHAIWAAAWCEENDGAMTMPVGRKLPNGWGLYDMLGNVDQWCSDTFRDYGQTDGTTIDPEAKPSDGGQIDHVLRGGSYADTYSHCRCAFRGRATWFNSIPASFIGFRVCRSYDTASLAAAPPLPPPLPSTEAKNQGVPRTADSVLAEYPIDNWCAPLLVPVIWGKEPSFFILDTGTANSILNSKDFPDIQVIEAGVETETSGGTRKLETAHPPDLHVGPFSLADSRLVGLMDLTAFSAVTGRRIVGILGASAVKNSVVQIDFDARKFRFLRSDEKPHPEWGNELAVKRNKPWSIMGVHVKIGGVEQVFDVDTGSDGALDVPTETFDRLVEMAKQPTTSGPKETAGGIVQLRSTRVPVIDVAGPFYRDLVIGETKASGAVFGLDFLERHLVTLDFPNNRVYLKPGKEFNHRADANEQGE